MAPTLPGAPPGVAEDGRPTRDGIPPGRGVESPPEPEEEDADEDVGGFLNKELVEMRSPAPRCVFWESEIDVGLLDRDAICYFGMIYSAHGSSAEIQERQLTAAILACKLGGILGETPLMPPVPGLLVAPPGAASWLGLVATEGLAPGSSRGSGRAAPSGLMLDRV